MQRSRSKTVTLDDIVITEELSGRSPRSPNWQAQAEAMQTLARQMVQPEIMLQKLVDTALDLCIAGSAGVSELTTTTDGEEVFRWNVLAGTLKQYVGGTTPRNSPCGVCLERGTPVLFSHPERYFTYFQAANTPIVEGLVLPLIADNHALGTIWIMSHDEQRHFDAEDVRVMTSLADFTATALLLQQRQTRELLAANAALEIEIAQRKQAEARARALISNLPGGAAFVVDRNLRYLLVEGEALAIAGFKPEDLVGRTIFEVLPPELAANYEPLYRKALAGEPFEYEHDAHDRTYISRGTPLLAENGEIHAVLAVSYEITDRKQAETALRESEERFRLFVTTSSDIVYRMSADWREMYRLVGKNFLVSTEDSSQTWIETYIPQEEQPRVWAAIQSAIDTKSMFELEHRVIQQNGAIGWTFSRAIPMLNEQGDIVEWFGTASDVTERKRSEEALRESEERFRTLANAAPALIWYNDAQGNNRFLNQYFLDFTGKSAEQIRGEGWHNLIHPDDAEFYIADYLAAVREQRSWHNRNRIRRHDGVWRWHDNYAQPLFNADGVYLGHVGVTIDNTNAIEAEIARRESEAKYRSLFKSINDAFALIEVLYDADNKPVDCRFLEVSPSFDVNTGLTQVQGKTLKELIPSIEPAWVEYYHQALVTNDWVHIEMLQEYLNIWFEVDALPYGNPQDRQVIIVFRNINERKSAEVALRESEEKYAALFAASPVPFMVLEANPPDFTITAANEAYFAATLTTREKLIGRRLFDVFTDNPNRPGDHGSEALALSLDRVLTSRRPDAMARTRYDIVTPDGGFEPHWWLAINAPLLDASGQVSAIIHQVTRVTELHLAEEAEREHQERQAFLLKLSDILQRFVQPNDIKAAAMRLLGEHLGVSRAQYHECDSSGEYYDADGIGYANGVPLLKQKYQIDDFGTFVNEDFAAGRPYRIDDLAVAPRVSAEERDAYRTYQIRAGAGVPLLRGGKLVAILAIHDVHPHQWTDLEMDLIRETAERIWTPVERARAEEALRESEAKYRTLFESINDGFCTIEVIFDQNEKPIDYRFLEISPSFERQTGLADALGKRVRELAPNHEEYWFEIYGNVALSGQSVRFENYARELQRWFEVYAFSVGELEDRQVAVVLSVINDRKQAQANQIQLIREQAAREQEHQRAETLAELDRAKTNFFSNVSHEFRTPLTLLLAPLQDVLSDQTNPLSPPQRERLELAHRNANRLLKLVNTLLDFSRIEAGRRSAVYEPTDLAMLTTELASVFRSAIERAGLRLIVDCQPLPEAVYVDREMWEKIVLNLLSNAFKFTLEGEIAVRLQEANGDRVMLQIEDTGTGIAPEEIPHLFERFYQIRGAKARTHEGSGIGLALVQELIRMHGGTVDVSSTVGQGTCFTVTIPIGKEHLQGDRIQVTPTLASTAVGAAPYVEEAVRWLPEAGGEGGDRGEGEDLGDSSLSSLSSLSPAHILLVDDNADMRDYLTRILGDRFQVEAVADGAAALAAVGERVPDLVVSDVMMPQLDGFGLLQALRADARTREIPIILLSARAGVESIVEGLEAGADDYLIKPFSASELVSRVNAHLQMAQLRSEALCFERTTSRRKDELLSNVAHELNTPLVAILGWTRLLRSAPPSQAMLMKSLDTIERNAMLEAKLVQDLLDISRIEAGKLRLSLQPVEPKSVIENAIAAVKTAAIAKDIHLHWKSTDRDPSVTVLGDADRLGQVISNLLSNAIKFTDVGGIVEVHLSFVENKEPMTHDKGQVTLDKQPRTSNDYAEIRVMDTGIGIAADFLPYIFDRFRQAEGSNSAKGLGLGLAIARHLVELHNGTIHAESSGVGQGATFTVRLPILQ